MIKEVKLKMASKIICVLSLISMIVIASAIDIASYEEVKDLPNHPEKVLIDVREAQEIADSGKIPTSVNIPLGDVKKAFSNETSREAFLKLYKVKKPEFYDDLIFHCHSGKRSAVAVAEVEKLGFTNVKNYEGSWQEWSAKEKL